MNKRIYYIIAATILSLVCAACSQNGKNSGSDVLSDSQKQNVAKTQNNAEKDTLQKNNTSQATVLDFYATWCGPCKEMTPVVEKMEEKYNGKIEFKSIDIDKEPELADKYQIDCVPTFVIVTESGVLDRISGSMPEEEFEQFIQKALEN